MQSVNLTARSREVRPAASQVSTQRANPDEAGRPNRGQLPVGRVGSIVLDVIAGRELRPA
jgi:hypothetical protein